MKFSAYQRTEQGGRSSNQDRVGYLYTAESVLFVVTDGLGGHANGEIAAQMTVDTMMQAFQKQASPVIADSSQFLSEALLQSHQEILQFSSKSNMEESPRTTLVALLIQNGQATWIHCGDSRLYWIRGEKTEQRTRDHSYAEQMPQSMIDSAEYLGKEVNRNMLVTCLGAPAEPIYDISPTVDLQIGDKFLLCTDGLWGSLNEDNITQTLAASSISVSVPQLIDLALKLGGVYSDNVTAVGMEWQG